MKKLCLFLISICIVFSGFCVNASEIEISSKSYILMESNSGKVIAENNADERLPPASITKIMTMLLTMEAIDNGLINENDIVTVSKNAAIKTGSHVYLSEGEMITVNELLKSVAVASGNDASIALAEYISGSHENFVKKMNQRAKELGMINTNFVNCNGLDDENHYSTARDIAYMTNELLKHKGIFKYTTIWMDSIRNGEFGLSNTNKLIRFYEGANGMKTGSTSKAGCCLSATAERGGMQLTAVVLGAPTSKDRFSDASDLLNFAFNNYDKITLCKKNDVFRYTDVQNGEKNVLKITFENTLETIIDKNNIQNITDNMEIPEKIYAPINQGDILGKIKYSSDGEVIGEVNLIAGENIEEVSFSYIIFHIIKSFINIV